MENCIFCKIVERQISAEILFENDLVLALMDISPVNPGHALVIPREHSRDLLEIDPEDLAAVARAGQRLAKRMPQALGAQGVNLINSCGAAAYQTVFHFHLHVIPRYANDTMSLPWTPGDGGDVTDEIAEALRA